MISACGKIFFKFNLSFSYRNTEFPNQLIFPKIKSILASETLDRPRRLEIKFKGKLQWLSQQQPNTPQQ
jgi:hypothetical protein